MAYLWFRGIITNQDTTPGDFHKIYHQLLFQSIACRLIISLFFSKIHNIVSSRLEKSYIAEVELVFPAIID